MKRDCGRKAGAAEIVRRVLVVLLAGGVMTATIFAADGKAVIVSEFIFETAPFPQCHASTIVETKKGLVAAWFGGTREKNSDVGIWIAHFGERHWTTPAEVANGVESASKRYPCWNPVLFQPRSGPLILFYKVGPSPDAWWGMWMVSSNHGVSWSKGRRLPDGVLGPIKNKPVQLRNGDILCGSSTEQDGWRVHFERLNPGTESWKVSGPVNDGKKIQAIQPSILFHKDGRLEAVGRTKQGQVFEIWSEDQGASWGEMTLSDLPNPNSGTDAVTLHDGRQCLVYNHCTKGRSSLNVALSKDGKEWEAGLVLEDEPRSEFSYPAIIQGHDGLVHITYTWKRKRIKHVAIDPRQIRLKGMQDRALPAEHD